ELFRRAPDRLQGSIVQVESVDAAEVRVRVHVRADLRTSQPQLGDTTLQLARRHLRVLQRNRGQARESPRMSADDFGDVIVQAARKIESVGRFRPIAEHY